MNDERADVPRVTQADVRPRLAGIGGFVDPISMRDVSADTRFATAGVNHVGIRIGDGYRADRGDALLFEQGIPGVAAVPCLPDAATHRAEVIRVWLRGHARDGDHPPSA